MDVKLWRGRNFLLQNEKVKFTHFIHDLKTENKGNLFEK